MIVVWDIVMRLREVTHIVVEIIPPFQNYKLIGSQRLVLTLRRYPPILVLFGLLDKQILSEGSRRVHLSFR